LFDILIVSAVSAQGPWSRRGAGSTVVIARRVLVTSREVAGTNGPEPEARKDAIVVS